MRLNATFINTDSRHWSFLVHRSNDFSHWLLILDWCPSSEYQAPKHQPNQLPSAANVMIDDNINPLEILFKISNTDI